MLEKLLGPRMVFAVLGLLLGLTIVFSPEPGMGDEVARLTSYSTAPYGGRGVYELADRLGWPVERREVPMRDSLDPARIYAVLATPIEQTASEVHRLLEAVRGGAGLLFVMPYSRSPLADSLGFRATGPTFQGFEIDPDPPRAHALAERFAEIYDFVPRRALRPREDEERRSRAARRRTAAEPEAPAIAPSLEPPAGREVEVFVQAIDVVGDSLDAPVVIGMRMGAGRVAIIADAELLRNDLVRIEGEDYGLLPVRLLEWLAPEGKRRVVFDEFHHGFGRQPSLARAMYTLLTGTAPGRTLAQLTLAVLLLLLAAATRGIVPPSRRRTERRSPLEHVGALARAYEQVEATRVATRRLVHGLRRRHATGAARALDDDAYLHAIAVRHPTLAPDVERAVAALRTPVSPAEFLAVGAALDHIDRTLRT